MFENKNKKDRIDYEHLNSAIFVGEKLLKLIFIAMLLYIATYINKEWRILSMLFTFLKIMIPFFIGLALAWLFNPIVDYLQKKKVKRVIGTSLVFVLFVGILFLVFQLVLPTLYHQLNDIISGAPQMFTKSMASIDNFLFNIAETYEINYDQLHYNVYNVLGNVVNSITVDLPNIFVRAIGALINGSIQFILGLFVGFYLLIDFDSAKIQLSKIIPKKNKKKTTKLLSDLDVQLKKYVQGTMFVLIILFICQTVAFTIAGLPAPLVFGLICAVTNVIPYVGPYIGGIPATAVGFTISPQVGVATLIAVVICQLIESNFLTPVVMSKTMKLHPVVIIFGLLVFGHFFGIIGMLFATPIISASKIIYEYIKDLYQEAKALK